MKYFIDFEFIEGFHKPWFGKRRHFIDLISVAVVAEDGRKYEAISNEFDESKASPWVRENVIAKLQSKKYVQDFYYEFRMTKEVTHASGHVFVERQNTLKTGLEYWYNANFFTQDQAFEKLQQDLEQRNSKWKSNQQIAAEILQFVMDPAKIGADKHMGFLDEYYDNLKNIEKPIFPTNNPVEFYGYYSAYDHVLLCSLFGTMMDLPKGFPMYTHDLKQYVDDAAHALHNLHGFFRSYARTPEAEVPDMQAIQMLTFDQRLQMIKNHPAYPVNIDEHGAMPDAIWNRDLYRFLDTYCV